MVCLSVCQSRTKRRSKMARNCGTFGPQDHFKSAPKWPVHTHEVHSKIRHFRPQVDPPNGPKQAPKWPPYGFLGPGRLQERFRPPPDPPWTPPRGPKLGPSWPQVGQKSAGRRFKRRENGFEVTSCAPYDWKIEFRTESGPVLDPPGG